MALTPEEINVQREYLNQAHYLPEEGEQQFTTDDVVVYFEKTESQQKAVLREFATIKKVKKQAIITSLEEQLASAEAEIAGYESVIGKTTPEKL